MIEIVGHQWWWEVRYPAEGVTTANEVHIPVGRPIAFRLTSADVIHSFWVPALGGKMDLLPDHINTLVLEADEPGVHHSRVRRVLRAPAHPDGPDRGGRAALTGSTLGSLSTPSRPPTRAWRAAQAGGRTLFVGSAAARRATRSGARPPPARRART